MTSFVSFFDSGSLGRSHYALVRNIETNSSPNDFIRDEIHSTKARISRASLKECKECLVILLHCAMSATIPLPPESFSFAIPNAITLMEIGKTVQDKRIGYLYCAEFLQPTDEMGLLLVNTLRKDLESSSVARICLAIDHIIQRPTEDMVPAVDNRLLDLLSHTSPEIRRRALLAFKSLSAINPDLFLRTEAKIFKRLEDSDKGVVNAALLASSFMVKIDSTTRPRYQSKIEGILKDAWGDKDPDAILTALKTVEFTGMSQTSVALVARILRYGVKNSLQSIIRQVFLALEALDRQILWDNHLGGILTPVHDVRSLLYSQDWNDRYLFLVCLETLDPIFWAGTVDEFPVVLEARDVQNVLQFLDASDPSVRLKTLKVLNKIDSGLIVAYYTQALQSIPSGVPAKAQNECIIRLLEILGVLYFDDGEAYAQNLFDVMQASEQGQTEPRVLESAIEMSLPFIRQKRNSFRIGAAAHLATRVANNNAPVGPTLMVIVAALLAEFFEHLAMSPAQLLIDVSRKLASYPASVQDACILAMLRIAGNCDEIPAEVIEAIEGVSRSSGRYIKKRCEQFTALVGDRQTLKNVITRAKSSSLPDFLESLHAIHTGNQETVTNSQSVPPRIAVQAPRLRYEAYLAPRPALARTLSSGSSNLSLPSYSGRSGHSSIPDALSPTITPGDLALAAGTEDFDLVNRKALQAQQFVEEAAKADLIAFDSPFIPDPSAESESAAPEPDKPQSALNFEAEWSLLSNLSYAARGWSERSNEDILNALASLDDMTSVVDRTDGETHMVLRKKAEPICLVLIRIRETEDGCLWQLRSSNPDLRLQVKRLLSES